MVKNQIEDTTRTAYGETYKTGSQVSLTTALLWSNVTLMNTLLMQKECWARIPCLMGYVLVSTSIVLQITTGILLIIQHNWERANAKEKNDIEMKRKKDVDDCGCNNDITKRENTLKKRELKTENLNMTIVIFSFLVAVINIFINGIEMT